MISGTGRSFSWSGNNRRSISTRIAELFLDSNSTFRIQKALGQGLSTAAYLARDESSEFDVVVRVLRTELASLPQVRAQFLDLSRRTIKLVHHNLVLTREVRAFPERHIYYVVRDHVQGVTLQKLLESGRVFGPDQIIKIVRQLLHALTPVHSAGMVHGSIKPSNIFLCGDDRVVLGDLALPLRGVSLQLDRLSYDFQVCSTGAVPPGRVARSVVRLLFAGVRGLRTCCAEHRLSSPTITSSSPACTTANRSRRRASAEAGSCRRAIPSCSDCWPRQSQPVLSMWTTL